MLRLFFVAVAFCTIGSVNCFAAVIKLEFCGKFVTAPGGILDGSFLTFEQSDINDEAKNYGLIDANIVTDRPDLALSVLTYKKANFSSIVMPTTSITSVFGGTRNDFQETIKGWRFLLPGQGEFFAVFPENWLSTLVYGDSITNDYMTEFRLNDQARPAHDTPKAVPEPSGLAIFGLSSAFIFLKRRFKMRTSSIAFTS
jgi:hypothetical protein